MAVMGRTWVGYSLCSKLLMHSKDQGQNSAKLEHKSIDSIDQYLHNSGMKH
ncbi:ABC transporter ATP-binding protein [Sesbania bispinosa]|nr:ABC transporter ATP-binding protein [Sesbania bispinosa]